MKPSLSQRLDSGIRQVLPLLSVLLLAVVQVVPTRIPGFSHVAPCLALVGVFYWSAYRPDLFPATAAFLVGVFYDILSGGALGVHAMIFLLTQGVVATQRRFLLGAPFVVVWLAFMFIAVAAGLAAWALGSLLEGAVAPVRPLALATLITLAIYPPLAWLLARGHALALGRV